MRGRAPLLEGRRTAVILLVSLIRWSKYTSEIVLELYGRKRLGTEQKPLPWCSRLSLSVWEGCKGRLSLSPKFISLVGLVHSLSSADWTDFCQVLVGLVFIIYLICNTVPFTLRMNIIKHRLIRLKDWRLPRMMLGSKHRSWEILMVHQRSISI